MRGRIESGQLVSIAPLAPADMLVDDIVFVQWHGNYLLHLVKQIDGDRLLIGNNLGKINGWVPASAVKGKVVAASAEDEYSAAHLWQLERTIESAGAVGFTTVRRPRGEGT
jgi:hypothetical protein